MVTIDDVLYHIAQELRDYSDADRFAAIEEFYSACTFQFRLCLTTDVEEAELSHLERYGRGHTFYFRASYYEHGKILAGQLYQVLTGEVADMEQHTGASFKEDDRIYLFVHVMNLHPAPVKGRIVEAAI